MPASAALKAWPGGCSTASSGGEIVDQAEAADTDGVTAMQFERRFALEARSLRLDRKTGDAAIALRLVGLRIGDGEAGDGGVGDPGLGAIQLPAALDTHRLHLQAAEIAADARAR